MEESLSCSICEEQFNNLTSIPKMLECGHTFCSPCMAKVIEANPTCPNCRAAIKRKVDTLPINFSFLKGANTHKFVNCSEKELITTIEVMKKKCIENIDILSKNKSHISTSLEVLRKCLEKLQQLNVSESKNIDSRNTKKVLNEIDEDLQKTDVFILCDDIKSSVSILLSNFENSQKYLTEIYNKVENKEKIFTVFKIEDQIKYGKISLFGNQLFLHCLSLSEVPIDSSLIWFDDLKQCVNNKNLYTFIKIPCNNNITPILIIEMFNKKNSLDFIRLCTGECGPSYKGVSFEKGKDNFCWYNILKVNNFVGNGGQASRVTDYDFCADNQDKRLAYKEGELLLFWFKKGSFEIGLIRRKGFIDGIAFGRIVYPQNIADCLMYDQSPNRKIIDCGIILDV